jgi:prepilin signal peptidase PulO-like enzyme (type II secretory pathway)
VISLFFRWVDFQPKDYFTMIMLLFLLIGVSERMFRLRFNLLVILLALLRLVFDYRSLLTAEFYLGFLFLFFSMLVLRIFILELAQEGFSRVIRLDELKAGMILAEVPAKSDGKERSGRGRVYYDLLSYLQELALNGEDGEAKGKTGGRSISSQLTKGEALAVKKRFGEGAGGTLIRIHQTMPFAPFLFFGVAITLAFRGDLISVLGMLVARTLGLG